MTLKKICLIVYVFVVPSFTLAKNNDLDADKTIQYCALERLTMKPLKDRLVYSVRDFGATGDGITNDTQALQRALDNTPSGAVLEFPVGTYLFDQSLMLSKDGTILMGKGGILKASNPHNQTLELTGYKSAVINMIFEGTGSKRSSQPHTTKVWVKGRWNQILNNTINGGASAGIFVFGAKDFRIAGNKVQNTLADGIHMTYGSRRGLVEGNHVHHTKDDAIAVVSYGTEKNIAGEIVIRNNTVSDVSWGRGITVVGGKNVLIKNNEIFNIKLAAGILVAQEKSFNTYGVENVIIHNNIVKNIQMEEDITKRRTQHGAIDVNSSGQRSVSNILVEENIIGSVRYAGVRILGDVCDIAILRNKMSHIQDRHPILVLKSICAPQGIQCTENFLDNQPMDVSDNYCLSYAEVGKNQIAAQYDFKALNQNGWNGCE